MSNQVNGLVGTFPATNPAFRGGYVYSTQLTGVVAANNYMALTNPTGSARTILVAGVFISSTINADIPVSTDPMRGFLATSVSGGTDIAVANIAKIRSTMPNPVGGIKTGNPSATLGPAWFNSPEFLGAVKATSTVHQIPTTIAAGSLTLLEGESVVIRSSGGSTDQHWNISIAWSEI